MSLDVVASLEIDQPPQIVAVYAFDPANDPTWIGGVTTVERQTQGPISVGSRVLRRGGFLGRPIEWLMEIVEHVPDRRLAMHALRSPFPMDVTYELETSPRGTQASIRVRGEARGMYGVLGPLTPIMVRRSVQADLGRLKRLIERGAAHQQ
jgi:hypothetical protein